MLVQVWARRNEGTKNVGTPTGTTWSLRRGFDPLGRNKKQIVLFKYGQNKVYCTNLLIYRYMYRNIIIQDGIVGFILKAIAV